MIFGQGCAAFRVDSVSAVKKHNFVLIFFLKKKKTKKFKQIEKSENFEILTKTPDSPTFLKS